MQTMKNLFYLFIMALAFGCSTKTEESTTNSTSENKAQEVINTEVKAIKLQYSNFAKEILSNGKLSALNKAELRFRTNENIAHIFFNNGDHVSKGATIASLDNFTLNNSAKQSMEQFERAKLELQDILLGQGYSLTDTATMPRNTLMASRIKSGYDKALADLEMAKFNLANAELKAPFDGVVANITLKANNMSGGTNSFCSVIDNSQFEAVFTVLESELGSLSKGQSVRIVPFALANLEVAGVITQVNPVIDDNGMVSVKAVCTNKDGKLADGMNVRVVIANNIDHQLVIPKLAVVLRSEKQVVFTVQDGLTKWNYVKTGLENSTSFTIDEGLKAGDYVVVEGNMNLAHDTKVTIKE